MILMHIIEERERERERERDWDLGGVVYKFYTQHSFIQTPKKKHKGLGIFSAFGMSDSLKDRYNGGELQDLARTSEIDEHVQREIMNHRSLKHPNILRFKELRNLERGVDILVAIPGHLVDMIERARVSLRMIKYLALDEAD
ncbi:unnamed protein product [Camellia sinensis]